MTTSFTAAEGDARVVFGPGALGRASEELEALGAERVLLVASERGAEEASMLAKTLGSRSLGVFSGAVQHVPLAVAEQARARARELDADCLLAYGGGSAIGLAKAVALEVDVRVACVPTTYSGSEMTGLVGIRDGDTKTGHRTPKIRPSLVFYDPELTLGLPVGISVTSLMNAMAHSVEALYAVGRNPMTDLFALESISLIWDVLLPLAERPDDLELRSQALRAAWLAGKTIPAGIGVHHKLAHVLGGMFDLPHGPTHSVLLPHSIAYNVDGAADVMRPLAEVLGVADAAGALWDKQDELHRRFGVPLSLAALGMAEDGLDAAAERAMDNAYPNPRPFDRDALRSTLEAAFHGRRPGTRARPLVTAPAALDADLMSGLGGFFESEALPGALPRDQNSPLPQPYGLYAEQVNSTPFTVERAGNIRGWLYRVRPSLMHTDFVRWDHPHIVTDFASCEPDPNLLRLAPLPIPEGEVDWVDGLRSFAGAGDASSCHGFSTYLWAASASMEDRSFVSMDGDMILAPSTGRHIVRTELGELEVKVGELVLLRRGMTFSIALPDGEGRGYAIEAYDAPFRLPDRGPIGANGLADERHFLAPRAKYEDRVCDWELVHKLGGALYRARQDHSPFDVVAWHGNFAPFKYDLRRFNALGSVSWDHPDPSILTVLTCPSDDHGRSAADFVVFPPRWDAMSHSYRPPFYHRNAATELNGILSHDSSDRYRSPGAISLTPLLSAHGLSQCADRRGVVPSDEPQRVPDDSLWIQFESRYSTRLAPWVMSSPERDMSFRDSWKSMDVRFDPKRR